MRSRSSYGGREDNGDVGATSAYKFHYYSAMFYLVKFSNCEGSGLAWKRVLLCVLTHGTELATLMFNFPLRRGSCRRLHDRSSPIFLNIQVRLKALN